MESDDTVRLTQVYKSGGSLEIKIQTENQVSIWRIIWEGLEGGEKGWKKALELGRSRFKNRVIELDLSKLFSHATEKIELEDIEAICVYGSVLYKHFHSGGRGERIKIRRKYWLFGPKLHLKTIKKLKYLPRDFDVMVITKTNPPLEEKIIKPRNLSSYDNGDSFYHHRSRSSINDFVVMESVVKIEEWWSKIGWHYHDPPNKFKDFLTYVYRPLHITYRSVEQFLTGIGHGDELSESVVRYGIPIIGKNRFEEIIRDIRFPKREPLHQVGCSEKFGGKLECKIV